MIDSSVEPCDLDDRFIAKELSKTELDAMTKFAPAYFDYMSNAITSNVSMLLVFRFASILIFPLA